VTDSICDHRAVANRPELRRRPRYACEVRSLDLQVSQYPAAVRVVVALGCLLGCGRIAFDAAARDAAVPAIDAARTACATAAPAQLITLSGSTYRYTDFDNTHVAVGDGTVTAFDATGAVLGSAQVGTIGIYTLPMAPGATRIDYTLTGYFRSHLYLDQPLDRDTAGLDTNLWTLGDGPLWTAGGMANVYDTVSATRDPVRTTLNVAIRHCDGSAIAGIVVTTEPPSELIAYTTDTGLVETQTTLPNTNAVTFNQEAGPVTVRAVDPSGTLTFPELQFELIGGDENALTILHPYE
jgi:hypothetical protein